MLFFDFDNIYGFIIKAKPRKGNDKLFTKSSTKMMVAVCFLAIIYSVVASPAQIPFEFPDEIDWSKVTFKNLYKEPINPVKNVDIPGSRIVGGNELAPNSAPYQVAIITDANTFCGGSLISSSAVLSAAHCTLSASFVEVRLGAHNHNQNENTQVRLTSSSIRNHELYNSATYENDISVITLPSAVTLSDYIKVVPLAPLDAGSYEGKWGLLAGWGRTTDASKHVAVVALRGKYLYVLSNLECSNSYGWIVDSQLCTSGVGIVGGCGGDSGGPLVVDGVQVGVASFYASRCEGGNPTGYTRISSLRNWILQYANV